MKAAERSRSQGRQGTVDSPVSLVTLPRKLQASRATMLSKLEGLSEYDRGRPMTPSGTNLLGLVKHLAGLEYGYLGESFGHSRTRS